ncbi:MAG: DNA-directed DNA polymerase II small subunit [Thermoplasmata archaeon]|nr:MAG: DNA-directed DNA polymerase II small subunit [Thermoplasmata archaeon]
MVIKDIDSKLIIAKFAMQGYNVHPSAVEILKQVSPASLDRVIDEVCKCANGSFIITCEDILPILERIKITKKERKEEKIEKKVRSEFSVRDITGNSQSEGTVEDFIGYFNYRFDKLSQILRNRINPLPINAIGKGKFERVEIVGMVVDVRETSSGNAMIELEDKTGFANVIATGKLKDVAMELLGDEVIGVSGVVRGRNMIADRIIFPDLPANGKRREWGFSIVFISDTHFGSKTFIEDAWNRFISWINCEIGNERAISLAESVKYLVVAGDIVDGIGVYPEQEKELSIKDIYQQYEEAASQFDRIPKEIKVIISPGNHDAVRQAEPQPSLLSEYADLFPKNVRMVGNPAYVELSGVKVLIYHGRSLDDVITRIPRMSYQQPSKAMEELLKRRLLVPSYGGRAPIAPEREDFLVIDEIPDVMHSGHVQTHEASFYRGVLLVNSSTWQEQTTFQRKMNLDPIPGIVTVYNGATVNKIKFC